MMHRFGRSAICWAVFVVLFIVPPVSAEEPFRRTEALPEQPFTIHDVIQQAAEYHPQVISAKRSLQNAQRDVQARQAYNAPSISFDATPLRVEGRQGHTEVGNATMRLSANQSTFSGLDVSASVQTTLEQNSKPAWNVQLSYALLRSEQRQQPINDVEKALFDVVVAEHDVQQAIHKGIREALETYHAIVRAQSNVDRANEALARSERHMQDVLHRLQLGAVSRIDVIEAETDLKKRQLQAEQEKRTLHERLHSFMEAIGIEAVVTEQRLNAQQYVAPWPQLVVPEFHMSKEQWLVQAEQVDIGLRQRALAVDEAEYRLRLEKQKQLPEGQVRAGLSQGRTSDTSDRTPPDQHHVRWHVQVDFSYTFADGGAGKRGLAQREHDLISAQEAYRDEYKEFQRRMDNLWYAYEDARVQADIAALTLEKADLEWQNAKQAHENFLVTDEQLEEAAANRQQAYDDWQQAVMSVYVTLWDVQLAAGMQPDYTMQTVDGV